MQAGFTIATRAGISICVDDMLVPVQKHDLIASAETEVKEIESQYTSASSRSASGTTRWWISGAAPATRSAKP